MSGAGKSTLAENAKEKLEEHQLLTLILDGDVVRERYDVKLGFGREDVERNNLNVAKLCEDERNNYDVILVPIISPIEAVRSAVKRLLSPGFFLLYVKANIKALRARDPKGLYKKADDGLLMDLIGYSDSNPYDHPVNCDLIIDTSVSGIKEINKSKDIFTKYIIRKSFESSVLL